VASTTVTENGLRFNYFDIFAYFVGFVLDVLNFASFEAGGHAA